jgi:DNA transposition AAA+ family ATPase
MSDERKIIPILEPGQGGEPSTGRVGRPWWVETPTSQAILDHMTTCKDLGIIGVVIGPPGCGKSAAAKRFAEKHRHTIVLKVSPATADLPSAMALLGTRLGVIVQTRSNHHVSVAIEQRLREEWATSAIVIDEAQHLMAPALEQFRHLWDASGCGMVFVGNYTFQNSYNSEKVAAFAAFRDRIGARLDLSASPTADDLIAFCRHHGVAGARELNFLARVLGQGGGLHVVDNIIRMAEHLTNGGPVKVEQLTQAAEIVGAGRKSA